jgi:membrane associated rhomboid family serine protease
MGLYDRDYVREGYEPRRAGSVVGTMRVWSVTTWLIIINVAVFILDPILFNHGRGWIYIERLQTTQGTLVLPPQHPLYGLGHFSLYLAIGKLEIWRFVTFQFLHAGLTHIAFNMIALYFFGPLIESYLGRGRYLIFYLLCGIGGPIAYVILWMLHLLIAYPWVPLVGASAGIFGILIAAAQVAPNATVLLYGILPMRLKTLAWVLLAMAAYTVLQYGHSGEGNAGGEAAHLGGAAIGFLLIRYPRLLRGFSFASLSRRGRPPF